MSSNYQRYAIYYSPRSGSVLAQSALQWLGVDAEAREVFPAPSEFVDSPRKYGFHATLKAPMRLTSGITYNELHVAVRKLAESLKPVPMGELKVQRIGRFLALMTDIDFHDAVSQLAWACVKELDHLRAELNAEEIQKRGNLAPDLKANLERWGYPYVGAEFRFHMTLTSSLDENQMKIAQEMLQEFDTGGDATLDSICIFGDPGNFKPFELVERFDLLG